MFRGGSLLLGRIAAAAAAAAVHSYNTRLRRTGEL